ncbi:hypothetical protein F5Y06DRAFT_302792 [Hypoxylon sp. FL0890]|nr:hypothetical protein F5Y06DRAFT_302792 [Hypoxylon sp. FL0890]
MDTDRSSGVNVDITRDGYATSPTPYSKTYGPLPHFARQAHGSNEKDKNKACQTATIAHPGHAPEGKTTAIGVEIITTLYTAPLARYRHPCGQSESKEQEAEARCSRIDFHSRATGISFINQGGLCSSFREHRVGRIL